MKRLFSVMAAFVLMTVSTYSQAQTPCSLKVAQSPAVRGVKLGMKTADVLALFPGSADQDDIRNALSRVQGYPAFGVISINLSPSRYATKERFTGIVNYNFVFVDDRLAEYQVQYVPPPLGPRWQRPDDFVSRIVQAYELPPPANWTTDPNVSAWRILKCDGFQLKASTMNFQGALTVATTETPWMTQRKREAEFEENIRRQFKP
jgi:hypothetical protein